MKSALQSSEVKSPSRCWSKVTPCQLESCLVPSSLLLSLLSSSLPPFSLPVFPTLCPSPLPTVINLLTGAIEKLHKTVDRQKNSTTTKHNNNTTGHSIPFPLSLKEFLHNNQQGQSICPGFSPVTCSQRSWNRLQPSPMNSALHKPLQYQVSPKNVLHTKRDPFNQCLLQWESEYYSKYTSRN